MVKTPTYPLAAFTDVILCSFEVYRQITRTPALDSYLHSREISDLKQLDFWLEAAIQHTTGTAP